MSTAYEQAVDVVREVGGRLAHELPAKLPSVSLPSVSSVSSLPSNLDWPDDLVERVADDLSVGLEAVKGVLAPAGTLAVGAGAKAAVAGGRTIRRHPLVYIAGGLAVLGLVAWVARRRRNARRDQRVDAVNADAMNRPVSAA
jgi:hypothetical protein